MNINLEIEEYELDLLRDHLMRIWVGKLDLTDRQVIEMILSLITSEEYAKQAIESEGYKV